jgi:hypothetical protein
MLIEHLGGEQKVTPPQRSLVERCAYLQLRCAMLDRRIVDGTDTEYDSKVYAAFSNALARTMARLGLVEAASDYGESQQTLEDVLRDIAAP